MAKQIQDMPLKTGVSGTEDILIQDRGITKRIKASELIDSVNLDNYYSKEEVDALLSNTTIDSTNYYTKSETSELIADYYDKNTIDAMLNNINVDLSDYYTKTEVNDLLNNLDVNIDDEQQGEILEELSLTWEQGGLQGSTGSKVSTSSGYHSKQTRTDFFSINTDKTYEVILSDDYALRIFEYNSDYTYVGKTEYDNSGYISFKGCQLYRFDLGLAGYSSSFSVEDIPDDFKLVTRGASSTTLEQYIHCSGDSLTNGSGSSVAVNNDCYRGYPYFLQQLITDGKTVVNDGVGGDGIVEICCRQGGIELFVKPFTIPSNTTSTPIELVCFDGTDVNNFNITNTSRWNPVTISGISGAIDFSSETSSYTFTRTTNGNSIEINRPVKVISRYQNHKGVLVIFMGTNDKPSGGTISDYFEYFENMIEWNGNKKYIIVGLTSKEYMPEVEEINKKICKKFGHHFLEIRKYLIEYGLLDSQITPTAQDKEDIANGEIPTSLRVDSVHFNDNAYEIIASLIYEKGKDLGYWS